MTDRTLVVLIEGKVAGDVGQDDQGRLRFRYDDGWAEDTSRTPLSLSMPTSTPTHGDEVIRPFLWGLLPDNELVLERWGRDYHVSPGNPFALLGAVGEDCAGAVQLADPERVAHLREGHGHIDWLSGAEVAAKLRRLRHDPTAWHTAETGQFSLAGAQSKWALYRDAQSVKWGVPSGATPTTHILKPAVTGFDDHDLNEHLCLATARHLGLPAARTQVMSFGDERAIVIERYDRHRVGDAIRRVHQEDLCQALGRPPAMKYQSDGGPSAEDVVSLLRSRIRPHDIALESTRTFVDALALNWVIAGTDAHAKNYSVLLAGRQVRLAPLYDIASMLPYEGAYVPKLRMAMKVGGEYRLAQIADRHWRRVAEMAGLDGDMVLGRVVEIVEQAPRAMARAADDPDVRALGSDLPQRLVDRVGEWAAACRSALG